MEYDQPQAAQLLWQHLGGNDFIGKASQAKDELTRFRCYVADLCSIGVDWTLPPDKASSGFFQKDSPLQHNLHQRAREIGQELHVWGGITRMRDVASAITRLLGKRAASNLSVCWNKIGWDGTDKEYYEATAALVMEQACSEPMHPKLKERLNRTWID